ncbi:MAG TPA: methyltransferase domain-containing protein, partial [Labilithrix sp.]|nr:methyltransferase domain-containing protein [Labilithrix sp.]
MSPFIASYVLDTGPEPTRLLECNGCGFRFFEDRLTSSEADRLYAGYRGDRYFRERNRHEPWYTRKVNDGIGGDDDVIRIRRDTLARFLRQHADVGSIDEVLDYGGDRGQLIPQGIGRKQFVYEISDVDSVSGVTRIGSMDELRERRFDLVLLSHVLEHCSEPDRVLEEVRALLRSNGSLLYVELPFERASLKWLGKSDTYGSYLEALRRVRPLLTAVDLYSTVFRTKFDTLPPLGFAKLHEHLNYFDTKSLGNLLERKGLETVALERHVLRSSLGRTPI